MSFGGGKKTKRHNNTKLKKTKKRSKKSRQTKKHSPSHITRKNKTQKIYSNTQFNSGDGMLTTVWGPSLWHTLHTMSFNYPVNPTPQDKKHYRSFICNLPNILPCKYCRTNLKNNLKSLPPTMEVMKNRGTFSKYVYDLHELVNKMLNKKSNLSFCDVQNRYEHFRARCTTEKPDVWKIKTIKNEIKKKDNSNKKKGEKGCTEPLYSGEKSKCILKIVPQSDNSSTFQMDKKCEKKRIN